MKRFPILLGLLAVLAVSLPAAPKHPAKKHGHRVPGVLNAATYPVRHPVKTVKAGKRVLW